MPTKRKDNTKDIMVVERTPLLTNNRKELNIILFNSNIFQATLVGIIFDILIASSIVLAKLKSLAS